MRIVLILVLVFCFNLVKPQSSVIQDWTKADCNGKSWHLYDYLDSNQVVALVFGMGCSSCTDAAGFFVGLKNQYNIQYPGRFKAFYMDFWDGHTCGVNVITSGLDADFDSCQTDLAFYTSAVPMTFVIIGAGPSHSGIYSFDKQFIFDFVDTTDIKTAIENYFNGVGISELSNSKNNTSVYPNPSDEEVSISFNEGEFRLPLKLTVNDIVGKEIQTFFIHKSPASINVSQWNRGIYFLNINQDGILMNKKIIIR